MQVKGCRRRLEARGGLPILSSSRGEVADHRGSLDEGLSVRIIIEVRQSGQERDLVPSQIGPTASGLNGGEFELHRRVGRIDRHQDQAGIDRGVQASGLALRLSDPQKQRSRPLMIPCNQQGLGFRACRDHVKAGAWLDRGLDGFWLDRGLDGFWLDRALDDSWLDEWFWLDQDVERGGHLGLWCDFGFRNRHGFCGRGRRLWLRLRLARDVKLGGLGLRRSAVDPGRLIGGHCGFGY